MHLCEGVYKQVWQNISQAVTDLKLSKKAKILDVGCWDGELTELVVSEAGLDIKNSFGVDFFDQEIGRARQRGIDARKVNLEKEKFPFPDKEFELVICNQVFEHLKNIYQPLDQIHRVLKNDGYLVFSVPNLSSLHNRLFLFFGLQPTSIRSIGPHIRGFTFREVKNLLELNNSFKVVKTYGTGFYPFPGSIAKILSSLLISNSHTVVFVAKKQKKTASWVKEVKNIEECSTTY